MAPSKHKFYVLLFIGRTGKYKRFESTEDKFIIPREDLPGKNPPGILVGMNLVMCLDRPFHSDKGTYDTHYLTDRTVQSGMLCYSGDPADDTFMFPRKEGDDSDVIQYIVIPGRPTAPTGDVLMQWMGCYIHLLQRLQWARKQGWPIQQILNMTRCISERIAAEIWS